jgi:hypothetical protein
MLTSTAMMLLMKGSQTQLLCKELTSDGEKHEAQLIY